MDLNRTLKGTIWGTSYFVSRSSAYNYYRLQGYDGSLDIDGMISRGEIHIGKPPLQPDEELVYLDDFSRYGIIVLDK